MVAASAPTPLHGVLLDHVAVAVENLPAAMSWWTGLGATPVAGLDSPSFRTEQVRLSNSAKVELISTGEAHESFIEWFLQRFGSGVVHHITLKVPGPLTDAVAQLRAAGLDVVDVSTADPHWHESFLRPSEIGGIIVQVAWAAGTDADFARRTGRPEPLPVDPGAPALREVVLGHRDLARAESVWRLLGAEVRPLGEDQLIATFTGSPIAVRIRRHDVQGPLGLVMDGVGPSARTAVAPCVLES